jgi:hypothetical protein
MRTILLLLLAATSMVSCIDSPSVTVVSPDGTKTVVHLGRNFMGKRQNVVAEASAPSIHVRQMVQNEDATEVPKSVARTIGTVAAADALAGTTQNAANNATAEVLGAHGVQKNKDTLNAAGKVTSEGIAKMPADAVRVGEIKPPGS